MENFDAFEDDEWDDFKGPEIAETAELQQTYTLDQTSSTSEVDIVDQFTNISLLETSNERASTVVPTDSLLASIISPNRKQDFEDDDLFAEAAYRGSSFDIQTSLEKASTYNSKEPNSSQSQEFHIKESAPIPDVSTAKDSEFARTDNLSLSTNSSALSELALASNKLPAHADEVEDPFADVEFIAASVQEESLANLHPVNTSEQSTVIQSRIQIVEEDDLFTETLSFSSSVNNYETKADAENLIQPAIVSEPLMQATEYDQVHKTAETILFSNNLPETSNFAPNVSLSVEDVSLVNVFTTDYSFEQTAVTQSLSQSVADDDPFAETLFVTSSTRKTDENTLIQPAIVTEILMQASEGEPVYIPSEIVLNLNKFPDLVDKVCDPIAEISVSAAENALTGVLSADYSKDQSAVTVSQELVEARSHAFDEMPGMGYSNERTKLDATFSSDKQEKVSPLVANLNQTQIDEIDPFSEFTFVKSATDAQTVEISSKFKVNQPTNSFSQSMTTESLGDESFEVDLKTEVSTIDSSAKIESLGTESNESGYQQTVSISEETFLKSTEFVEDSNDPFASISFEKSLETVSNTVQNNSVIQATAVSIAEVSTEANLNAEVLTANSSVKLEPESNGACYHQTVSTLVETMPKLTEDIDDPFTGISFENSLETVSNTTIHNGSIQQIKIHEQVVINGPFFNASFVEIPNDSELALVDDSLLKSKNSPSEKLNCDDDQIAKTSFDSSSVAMASSIEVTPINPIQMENVSFLVDDKNVLNSLADSSSGLTTEKVFKEASSGISIQHADTSSNLNLATLNSNNLDEVEADPFAEINFASPEKVKTHDKISEREYEHPTSIQENIPNLPGQVDATIRFGENYDPFAEASFVVSAIEKVSDIPAADNLICEPTKRQDQLVRSAVEEGTLELMTPSINEPKIVDRCEFNSDIIPSVMVPEEDTSCDSAFGPVRVSDSKSEVIPAVPPDDDWGDFEEPDLSGISVSENALESEQDFSKITNSTVASSGVASLPIQSSTEISGEDDWGDFDEGSVLVKAGEAISIGEYNTTASESFITEKTPINTEEDDDWAEFSGPADTVENDQHDQNLHSLINPKANEVFSKSDIVNTQQDIEIEVANILKETDNNKFKALAYNYHASRQVAMGIFRMTPPLLQNTNKKAAKRVILKELFEDISNSKDSIHVTCYQDIMRKISDSTIPAEVISVQALHPIPTFSPIVTPVKTNKSEFKENEHFSVVESVSIPTVTSINESSKAQESPSKSSSIGLSPSISFTSNLGFSLDFLASMSSSSKPALSNDLDNSYLSKFALNPDLTTPGSSQVDLTPSPQTKTSTAGRTVDAFLSSLPDISFMLKSVN